MVLANSVATLWEISQFLGKLGFTLGTKKGHQLEILAKLEICGRESLNSSFQKVKGQKKGKIRDLRPRITKFNFPKSWRPNKKRSSTKNFRKIRDFRPRITKFIIPNSWRPKKGHQLEISAKLEIYGRESINSSFQKVEGQKKVFNKKFWKNIVKPGKKVTFTLISIQNQTLRNLRKFHLETLGKLKFIVATLLATHSSHLCCHEGARWGAKTDFVPGRWKP